MRASPVRAYLSDTKSNPPVNADLLLGEEAAAQCIEALCQERAVTVAGRLPFHSSVVEAMVSGRTVVEMGGTVADAISEMWCVLEKQL